MNQEEDVKIFLQTATKICTLESELISIHERRIAAIRKMRSALKRGDRQDVGKHLNDWLRMWDDLVSKTHEIQKVAQAGVGRNDGDVGAGSGRELGGGNPVDGGRAEAPTKPET